MARDTFIIRPDRPARPSEREAKVLTREERVALLANTIIPDVRVALETRQGTPPSKRRP